MHPDSSAGDRPFLYVCSCPGSCCYGVFHNLTPFLFACTHRHALSGAHSFSLVLMGDTHGLSYSYPEALEATGAYIAQRIESESIAAVLHAGDLVDNGFKDWQ